MDAKQYSGHAGSIYLILKPDHTAAFGFNTIVYMNDEIYMYTHRHGTQNLMQTFVWANYKEGDKKRKTREKAESHMGLCRP